MEDGYYSKCYNCNMTTATHYGNFIETYDDNLEDVKEVIFECSVCYDDKGDSSDRSFIQDNSYITYEYTDEDDPLISTGMIYKKRPMRYIDLYSDDYSEDSEYSISRYSDFSPEN